jgi:hypothetical protein
VLSLDSVEKKDRGRLDRFHVIICIIATQLQFIIHFPPVSSGSRFHTHTFWSLLRVLYASSTVQDTPSRNAELSSANLHVPDVSGTRPGITDMRVSQKSQAGSHLLRRMRHPLATKEAEKFGKVEYCGSIHTLRPPAYQGGDMCKVRWRSLQKCGFV